MSRAIYQSGQVEVIFKYITDRCRLFVVGGPADGDEGQLFKKAFPKVTVVGFEPCRAYYLEQRDVRKFPGMMYDTALWCKSGLELPFVVADRSSRLLVKAFNAATTYHVKTTALKDCNEVKALGKNDTLALWIDVERSEPEVLQGSLPLLKAKKIELVCLEVFAANFQPIESLLNSYGLIEHERCNWNSKGKDNERYDSIFSL